VRRQGRGRCRPGLASTHADWAGVDIKQFGIGLAAGIVALGVHQPSLECSHVSPRSALRQIAEASHSLAAAA
jgi:hypothetical protein